MDARIEVLGINGREQLNLPIVPGRPTVVDKLLGHLFKALKFAARADLAYDAVVQLLFGQVGHEQG